MQREFTDEINPFALLSASESLQPFYEYDDRTRRVMGNLQFGQFGQLDNPDEPLVQTSFESIIPHLASDRFAIKAKKDGIVKKITKETIIVKNKDGTESKYSIKPTRSRTKRGIYIPMKYHILAKDGQKISEGDLLATTSSLKTGKLASGKNLVVAQMSYRGMNYEDGWVVTEAVQEKYEQKILEKITVVVPVDAKIKDWNLITEKDTNPGDILISFTGSTDLDKFIVEEEDNDESNTDDVLTGVEYSGSQTNYRSPGGKITDIVIKLNNKNVDSTIFKEWKSMSKDIETRKQECQLLKHDHKAYVDCISDIPNTEIIKIGGHSVNGSEFDGAVIEIYIEKPNKIANGSKFTLAATGGKGTVQYIVPKGEEPVAEKTKLKIEFIPTPLSIVSRKNISILLLMYSGKVVYFLNKKLQELVKADQIKKARELILEVFTHLDASKDKFLVNEAMGFFDSKSSNEIKKFILGGDPLSKPAFPLLVPPHKNRITMENIQKAANVLGIPLNEKVYIPEEGILTEKEVPVGIMPINYLEHFPKAMAGARGSLSVSRQTTTGQGRSGTRVGAGAIKLGLYDLFGMAYKEPGLIIKEVHGLHSDNKDAKRKFQKEVLKTGKMPEILDMKIDAAEGKTKKLVETFFRGAMLEPDL
jgi:DNA-directed RNA polymerase beta subunit